MKYVRVEKNAIVEGPKNLPRNWRHVSGLNIDLDNAKTLGWLPYSEVKPTFDPATHSLGVKVIEITEDRVTGVFSVVALDDVSVLLKSNAAIRKEIRDMENTVSERRRDEAIVNALIDDDREGINTGMDWMVEMRTRIAAKRGLLVPEPEQEGPI
jgi:hypothetical protein